MQSYELSELAAQDVENIYRRGVVEFGEAQADAYHDELYETFAMLAMFPRSGRARPGLAQVRIQPKAAHIVACEVTDKGVRIVRVLHRSQDWQSIY